MLVPAGRKSNFTVFPTDLVRLHGLGYTAMISGVCVAVGVMVGLTVTVGDIVKVGLIVCV